MLLFLFPLVFMPLPPPPVAARIFCLDIWRDIELMDLELALADPVTVGTAFELLESVFSF